MSLNDEFVLYSDNSVLSTAFCLIYTGIGSLPSHGVELAFFLDTPGTRITVSSLKSQVPSLKSKVPSLKSKVPSLKGLGSRISESRRRPGESFPAINAPQRNLPKDVPQEAKNGTVLSRIAPKGPREAPHGHEGAFRDIYPRTAKALKGGRFSH